MFQAAAEGGPNDILKLYNSRKALVNISPKLPENTPDTPYQLDVIATQFNGIYILKQSFFLDVTNLIIKRQIFNFLHPSVPGSLPIHTEIFNVMSTCFVGRTCICWQNSQT